MSNLKNKLAQKVETIENNNSNTVHDNCENVILLNTKENNNPTLTTPQFTISIDEAKERIIMLQNFIKEMMIPNIDYGIIPKCNKPSLFKSGAEKLCDIFGFSKQIEILNRIENWEKGLFHYEVKVTLINKRTNMIEAEGIGACNTNEKKYKTQDSYSIINTVLKMAKKRALIDAVLSATRSSGIFTQDIEDIGDITATITESNLNTSPNRKHNLPNTTIKNTQQNKNSNHINKQQQSDIFSIVTNKHIPINQVKSLIQERYEICESKLLSREQANDFIQFLKLFG